MRENRFPHLAMGILACDQATKLLVERCLPLEVPQPVWGGTLALTHIQNAGVALGLLEGTGRLVVVASVAALVWLCCFWASLPAGGAWPATFTAGLSCFVGGSAGNTFDRQRLGHVTDFIQLPNGLVINLADVAIALGALLVCHALWRARPRRWESAIL